MKRTESKTPDVIAWQIFYCFAMVVMYVLLAIYVPKLMEWVVNLDPEAVDPSFETSMLVASILACLSALAHLVAVFTLFAVEPSPNIWLFNTVIIGLSMASPFCWLFTIPMFVAWMRPATREYFGYVAKSGKDPGRNRNSRPTY
jgi:hypothetical protein